MMFFSADTGVHALAGRALADYLSKGGVPVVGFPDTMPCADPGSAWGAFCLSSGSVR